MNPTSNGLVAFVAESNRIEGIMRDPTEDEIRAHQDFMAVSGPVEVGHLERFVRAVAGAPLRRRVGMNVRVGAHHPPLGGPQVESDLVSILATANKGERSAFDVHRDYETLHPFMDGNGRSGRVLWAWQTWRAGRNPFHLSFLHRWYYDSLDGGRK